MKYFQHVNQTWPRITCTHTHLIFGISSFRQASISKMTVAKIKISCAKISLYFLVNRNSFQLLVSFDCSNNFGAVDLKMDESIPAKKSSCKK